MPSHESILVTLMKKTTLKHPSSSTLEIHITDVDTGVVVFIYLGNIIFSFSFRKN